jgi:hypothetical protein
VMAPRPKKLAGKSPFWWKAIMVLAGLSLLFVILLFTLMKITGDSL